MSDLPEAHLIAGLAGQGVTVRVLASPATTFREVWARAGIVVEPLTIASRADRDATAQLGAAVDAFKPDIVHAFSNRSLACSLSALKKRPHPKLVAYRGTIGHVSLWDVGARRSYLNARVKAISCVANAVKEYLLSRGVPLEKLATIPKGHDPAWYEGSRPIRESLGLDADAFVIGCVANMRKVKGIPVLLEAVARLRVTQRVQVALVGEVRHRAVQAVRKRAELNDKIVFTGYRADAARLARVFDVFVMPSLEREGLPKAVVEAMIQGVPVVVSDAGGLPELVVHGESGLLFPAGKAAPLCAALEKMIRDVELRRRLGVGAQRRIESAFHVKKTIDLTRKLYERLLA